MSSNNSTVNHIPGNENEHIEVSLYMAIAKKAT